MRGEISIPPTVLDATSTDPYSYADFDPFEAGANTGCHGRGTGHALARHVCQHDVVIPFSL
jgi:hypothetical protein